MPRRVIRLLACVALLLTVAVTASAQNRVHIGLGYNQSYAALDSLNYVLDRFNAENSWTAEHPLRPIHASGGITGHLGGDFGGVLVDFSYTMRMASSRARDTESTYPQQLLVRYTASTLDLGVGYFVFKKPRFRIALGQSIDFGNLRVGARRTTIPAQTTAPIGRYVNELHFGTSTFAHIFIAFQDGVGPGIFIRPYYQFGLRKNDYSPLNHALRPVESLSDPVFLLGRQSNIGLKVGVYLGS